MLGVLGPVLDPAEAAGLAADWEASFGSSAASSGSSSSVGWEQQVMLHHPGRHPLGAICPAQLLLCPPSSGSAGRSMGVEGAASASTSSGSSMQACLWVHPAAAAEAHAALKAAAAAAHSRASMQVLNVRRLELRGGAADTALAVMLAGATASGITSPASGSHSRRRSSRHQQHRQQAAAPEAAQEAQQAQRQDALPPPPLPQPMAGLQDGEAVQLLLPDPRLCKPVALGSAAAGLLQPAGADEPQQLDLLRLQRVPLPLSEAELSSRRQQLRRRMLQLEQPAGGASGGASQAGQQQQQQQQDEVERRGYCPAVLVRHDPAEADGVPGEPRAAANSA